MKEVTLLILFIVTIILTLVLLKTKLDIYVLALWMYEKKYPLPNAQETKRLAKMVTDKWFNRD